MNCPNCHSEIEPGDRFCPGCGLDLEQAGIWSRESTATGKQEDWERDYVYEETQKTHKKNQKGKALLIIAALIVAGIALGVGVFAIKKHISKEEKQQTVLSGQAEGTNEQQEKKKRLASDSQESQQKDDEETNQNNQEVDDREETDDREEEEPKVDISAVTVSFISAPSSLGSYYKLQPTAAGSSSELVQENRDSNDAWAAMDGKTETSWQEGVSGSGVGEGIWYSFSSEVEVKYLTFCLGNWRSADYAEGNNRPKELKVAVGELEFEVEFPKDQQEYWLELSSPVPADEISFEIASVYKGTKWDDTCIAEIGIYGK